MNLEDINKIKELLSTPQKIAIIPHKNPDGDAIGSTLGLWHYLKNAGHDATVVSPNDSPKFLKWMPGCDAILNFEKENSQAKNALSEATLIFTLDFNDFGRVGQMEQFLEDATAQFVMIDHHQAPSDYAVVTYSDVTMSSTCEMVYHFIDYLGDSDKVTPEMANCLYTGIMTDTGSFRFRSTTSKTHVVAGHLIDKGAKNSDINNAIYNTNSPSRLHLLGCALKNMVILDEYSTAYITLSQDELDLYKYKKGDTEGFVNYGLTLEGIKFAVIFIENREEGIIKISFRSQGNFSVNKFARTYFEGGGHDNAAGGKSDLSLKETAARFLSILPEFKNELVN
ncbi:bifunctional oligoribonuclease/PAP phosphatase NrnA [Cellulophaga baltica]|uniref:DHH family phosphoesterase n=1 Tax=Cellulophaga TaxID=104264 RepID=UPI001C07E1F7|nr:MULTISPECIES: bifunctional oligoribonuclease/PAP phosphatase NrnA [Cellulophaga]MBU2996509.1 bifunctional oligoribonuclease/PAP phosphatase NrnA [Cellulophaga baltica]MDO6767903.1 bifunctional oligoribonuclease/PAP phosphatase NrnA [Cellulophaga sp. 1_MG-2023]